MIKTIAATLFELLDTNSDPESFIMSDLNHDSKDGALTDYILNEDNSIELLFASGRTYRVKVERTN